MERPAHKTLTVLACCALVVFTVLCGVLAAAVIDVNTRLATTFGKLDNELDEMHRLTLEAGLTAMEARKASAKESKYLDQWNSQISLTMTDVQAVMTETQKTVASIQPVAGAAVDTLRTTQQTVQAVQPALSQATEVLKAAQTATQHLDTIITDPAIPATLANVQGVTGHLDATAADVQQTVFKYTHPGIWSKVKSFALDVAHVFNPL